MTCEMRDVIKQLKDDMDRVKAALDLQESLNRNLARRITTIEEETLERQEPLYKDLMYRIKNLEELSEGTKGDQK